MKTSTAFNHRKAPSSGLTDQPVYDIEGTTNAKGQGR
jgi:hypothetical protein